MRHIPGQQWTDHATCSKGPEVTAEPEHIDPYFTRVAQAAARDRDRREGAIGELRDQLAERDEATARREDSALHATAAFGAQIEALERAYAKGLAQALKALYRAAETGDNRHEEISGLFAALTAAAGAEGEQTRQKITDAVSHARTLLVHVKDTKSSVVNLEHVITTAVAMARDQNAERIESLATEHRQAAEAAAGRGESALEALAQLSKTTDDSAAVLGKTSYEVEQLSRAVPTHGQAVIDAVKTTADEHARAALDIEHRLNQALNVSSERTDGALRQAGGAIREMNGALVSAAEERARASQALTSIAGDLGNLAGEFESFAGTAATASALDSLRGDVNALGELLAGTTESFEGAVTGAVDTLTALRTAWGEETRRVLVTLEEMGRVFLEKANGSEHARDAAVIELGRRVARLELDRPAALTTGS